MYAQKTISDWFYGSSKQLTGLGDKQMPSRGGKGESVLQAEHACGMTTVGQFRSQWVDTCILIFTETGPFIQYT